MVSSKLLRPGDRLHCEDSGPKLYTLDTHTALTIPGSRTANLFLIGILPPSKIIFFEVSRSKYRHYESSGSQLYTGKQENAADQDFFKLEVSPLEF